jgi:hypothetical protein
MYKLLRLLAICTVAYSVLFTGAGAAAQCNPVAYLFRHAEDKNQDKVRPFVVTLTESGLAHAQLYIEMIDNFQQQQQEPKNCPIRAVYALNPRDANGNIGTSNPYWTAEPLAQVAQTAPAEATDNTNAIITVEGMRLTEKLNQGEGPAFVAAIKAALDQDHSVAIFWTSQGMCAVATSLGLDLPDPYNCDEKDPKKPPRNSVFQFNYNVSGGTFTSITEYAQCFNYNKSTDSFSNGTYYCQYSYNLNDWDYPEDSTKKYPGFWNSLQKLSGRICAKNSPPDTCNLP